MVTAGNIRLNGVGKCFLFISKGKENLILYTLTLYGNIVCTVTTYHVNEVADSEDISKEFPDALAAQNLI